MARAIAQARAEVAEPPRRGRTGRGGAAAPEVSGAAERMREVAWTLRARGLDASLRPDRGGGRRDPLGLLAARPEQRRDDFSRGAALSRTPDRAMLDGCSGTRGARAMGTTRPAARPGTGRQRHGPSEPVAAAQAAPTPVDPRRSGRWCAIRCCTVRSRAAPAGQAGTQSALGAAAPAETVEAPIATASANVVQALPPSCHRSTRGSKPSSWCFAADGRGSLAGPRLTQARRPRSSITPRSSSKPLSRRSPTIRVLPRPQPHPRGSPNSAEPNPRPLANGPRGLRRQRKSRPAIWLRSSCAADRHSSRASARSDAAGMELAATAVELAPEPTPEAAASSGGARCPNWPATPKTRPASQPQRRCRWSSTHPRRQPIRSRQRSRLRGDIERSEPEAGGPTPLAASAITSSAEASEAAPQPRRPSRSNKPSKRRRPNRSPHPLPPCCRKQEVAPLPDAAPLPQGLIEPAIEGPPAVEVEAAVVAPTTPSPGLPAEPQGGAGARNPSYRLPVGARRRPLQLAPSLRTTPGRAVQPPRRTPPTPRRRT